MGRNLLSLQPFLPTPNLPQLPLKTTHHAAHSGMHIPYQSPRVFCAPLECLCGVLPLASPNPHHVHCANSQSPCICTLAYQPPFHGWCTIMCPPYTLSINILQFSHTQVLPCMFQIRSHCCIWTQLPTLSPTSWSDPASTLALEALLLGGWHTHWRPTTTPQLPPAMFCLCACAHLHLCPDCAAFGPAHLSLPFQHPGQFGPPLAPKAILPVGWCTH